MGKFKNDLCQIIYCFVIFLSLVIIGLNLVFSSLFFIMGTVSCC